MREVAESNSFHTLFCLLAGLCCFMIIYVDTPSNLEKRPLRESLETSVEFTYSSAASIALVIPLLIDLLLDVFTKLTETPSIASKKPPEESSKFNFLNIYERILILAGVSIVPMVAFIPKTLHNLGLLYVCCSKCQQLWVGGTIVLSLCRYDKEYWSTKSTLASLFMVSVGLIGSPLIDNIYAAHPNPGQAVVLIDLGTYILVMFPCFIFMMNSVRWLILVYWRANSWKSFLMCRSKHQIEEPAVPTAENDTVNHTFFPMVYTMIGTTVVLLLCLLAAATARVENYSGLNLLQSNGPFMLFIVLISTLSMRMVKFEVVQGLVSTTHATHTTSLHLKCNTILHFRTLYFTSLH